MNTYYIVHEGVAYWVYSKGHTRAFELLEAYTGTSVLIIDRMEDFGITVGGTEGVVVA